MGEEPKLSVIIPTLASRERAETLERAISSIRTQSAPCHIITVVNGGRKDGHIVSNLKEAPDIQLIELAQGGFVAALARGVGAVETPLFCFLDDDDILNAEACARRIDFMTSHPDIDVLVTPGERRALNGTVRSIPDYDLLDLSNTLESLLHANWLASCGGVFRRERVSQNDFSAMPRYLEWTYLAFHLACERKIHFLQPDEPFHYTIYETAISESRELEYYFAMPENLMRLCEFPSPDHIRRLIAEKVSDSYHTASVQALQNKMLRRAWKFHMSSLKGRGILKYVLFTRRLLYSGLRA